MKILNLSLDKSILDKNSKAAMRIVEHGNLADGYVIIVPEEDYREVRLSEKVFVYGSGGNNKIFQLINVYRTAKKLLRRGEFDVTTVQDQYYLALVGRILAKKFKTGLELQIHGFEKYSGLRKIIADFVIPRASAIRCVSQRLKRQLMRDFGAIEEKITVAPIYSESVKFIKSKVHKVDSENNKFIFLTVGRLVSVKNISLQIKAMAKLVESEESKVESKKIELWIVGDGLEKLNLKYQISKLKLENNVKLLGWQNNPEKFYSQADAFLLTSDYEGWGMVAVEAASYGLPIIMTDVGCAGELIENEKSGLVVPVNNQVRLEEAMVRIINDDNLRKKLAEVAISVVKKLPSKEETMALYKQSWEKATKNK